MVVHSYQCAWVNTVPVAVDNKASTESADYEERGGALANAAALGVTLQHVQQEYAESAQGGAALKGVVLAFGVLGPDGADEQIGHGILPPLDYWKGSLDAAGAEGTIGQCGVCAFAAEQQHHAIGLDAERTDRVCNAPDLCSGPSALGFWGTKSWVVRLTNSITFQNKNKNIVINTHLDYNKL